MITATFWVKDSWVDAMATANQQARSTGLRHRVWTHDRSAWPLDKPPPPCWFVAPTLREQR